MIDRETLRKIESIAAILRAGGVAIIPTDTVYGVAASLEHPNAIEQLFEIKGRPADKPIPILIDGMDPAMALTDTFTPMARKLASVHWPGALTIVVRASSLVPDRCLGPGGTVGLRVPDHEATRELIRQCGGALAVTSANKSGDPETRDAEVARVSLSIENVLDTGLTPGGTASTVVDATQSPPRILRHGAIVETQIAETLSH